MPRRSLIPLVLATCLAACGTKISSPFVVNLTLDDVAAAELRASGERVKLIADYYWTPNSGGPSHDENEFGYVLGGYPIGEEVHEVLGAGRVAFRGSTRRSTRVRSGDGETNVLINVVSARRTDPLNILECGVYEGSLTVASTQGIDIHCSMPGIADSECMLPADVDVCGSS